MTFILSRLIFLLSKINCKKKKTVTEKFVIFTIPVLGVDVLRLGKKLGKNLIYHSEQNTFERIETIDNRQMRPLCFLCNDKKCYRLFLPETSLLMGQ